MDDECLVDPQEIHNNLDILVDNQNFLDIVN